MPSIAHSFHRESFYAELGFVVQEDATVMDLVVRSS
jgi:hypothetical protein